MSNTTTIKNADRCARCGHDADWHRLDDANPHNDGSPAAWVFRCIGYGCEVGGPLPPEESRCKCPDFVAPASSEKNPQ